MRVSFSYTLLIFSFFICFLWLPKLNAVGKENAGDVTVEAAVGEPEYVGSGVIAKSEGIGVAEDIGTNVMTDEESKLERERREIAARDAESKGLFDEAKKIREEAQDIFDRAKREAEELIQKGLKYYQDMKAKARITVEEEEEELRKKKGDFDKEKAEWAKKKEELEDENRNLRHQLASLGPLIDYIRKKDATIEELKRLLGMQPADVLAVVGPQGFSQEDLDKAREDGHRAGLATAPISQPTGGVTSAPPVTPDIDGIKRRARDEGDQAGYARGKQDGETEARNHYGPIIEGLRRQIRELELKLELEITTHREDVERLRLELRTLQARYDRDRAAWQEEREEFRGQIEWLMQEIKRLKLTLERERKAHADERQALNEQLRRREEELRRLQDEYASANAAWEKEREKFELRIKVLLDENGRLEAFIRKLEAEIRVFKQENDLLNRELRRLKNVVKELRSSLAATKEDIKIKLAQLQKDFEKLAEELFRVQEENVRLAAENERLRKENAVLNARISELTKRIEALEAQINKLREKNRLLLENINELTGECKRLSAENLRLLSEKDALLAENEELIERIRDLEAKLSVKERQLASLKRELSQTQENLRKSQTEVERLKRRETELLRQLEALELEKEALKAENIKLYETIDALNKRIKELEEEIARLRGLVESQLDLLGELLEAGREKVDRFEMSKNIVGALDHICQQSRKMARHYLNDDSGGTVGSLKKVGKKVDEVKDTVLRILDFDELSKLKAWDARRGVGAHPCVSIGSYCESLVSAVVKMLSLSSRFVPADVEHELATGASNAPYLIRELILLLEPLSVDHRLGSGQKVVQRALHHLKDYVLNGSRDRKTGAFARVIRMSLEEEAETANTQFSSARKISRPDVTRAVGWFVGEV